MNASTRVALGQRVLVAWSRRVVTQAHFKLVEPASWIVEDDRGDPQKAGPCGGSNTDYGKPSYIVSQAVGGAMLHIKVQETIYHPGHYRVALAVNSPTELPVDPKASDTRHDRGPLSVAEIQNPVQPRCWPTACSSTREGRRPLETDVTLPNISCKKCTLQVIQFMEQHGVNNPGMFNLHSPLRHRCRSPLIRRSHSTSHGQRNADRAVLQPE